MTVAAVVLTPDPDAALADADGVSAIRRVVQVAWTGGALPILVVGPDPRGEVAAELEGLSAVVVEPPAVPPGIAWFAAGMSAARDLIDETSGALLWPFRHVWVDPETVTSLVEAHGLECEAVVRPCYEGKPGFPTLLPLTLRERLAGFGGMHGPDALASLEAAGIPATQLDLGDPGIAYTLETPHAELPEYQGPQRPAGSEPPEA